MRTMARVRTIRVPERKTGPLTYWVHRPQDNDVWAESTRFEPDLPPPDAEGMFPLYVVEHQGHEIIFASTQELRHAIDVLGRDRLPSAQELAEAGGETDRAYMHWIATFPSRLKADDERRVFVALLVDLVEQVEATA